jgi:hypothetical protein
MQWVVCLGVTLAIPVISPIPQAQAIGLGGSGSARADNAPRLRARRSFRNGLRRVAESLDYATSVVLAGEPLVPGARFWRGAQ